MQGQMPEGVQLPEGFEMPEGVQLPEGVQVQTSGTGSGTRRNARQNNTQQ